jgi:hypothetical protein
MSFDALPAHVVRSIAYLAGTKSAGALTLTSKFFVQAKQRSNFRCFAFELTVLCRCSTMNSGIKWQERMQRMVCFVARMSIRRSCFSVLPKKNISAFFILRLVCSLLCDA